MCIIMTSEWLLCSVRTGELLETDFQNKALAVVICSDCTQYGRGDMGVFRSYLMNTVLMLTIEILKQRSCYISQT